MAGFPHLGSQTLRFIVGGIEMALCIYSCREEIVGAQVPPGHESRENIMKKVCMALIRCPV